jgi:hypothetical protein
MSEPNPGRKVLLSEAVPVSRRDWLELTLALHALRTSGQDWVRSYEVGANGALICRCYSGLPARLRTERVSLQDQYDKHYKGWYETEKRRVRDLLSRDARLMELANLADSMMMDVYDGYGEASAMLCRLSVEGVGWSQRG